MPPTVTASASFFRRAPWQSGHSMLLIQPEISSRIQLLLVSRKRRSRLLTMPSKSVLYAPFMVPVSRRMVSFSPPLP